jgi:DNA-binding protein HU-beta
MNKSELITAIVARTGQDKKQVAQTITAALDTIQATVADGGDVTLTGFGSFKPSERKARSQFSAMLGRVVETPAQVVPSFRPGAGFKQAVNSTAA